MNDCYNNITSHTVKIVDLYLFDKSSKMYAFLSEEKKKLRIEISAFEVSFFAVHDAWQGTPRIMVAYDKSLILPKLVRIGSLHHEVAHSVLHGSLEFYSFPIPVILFNLERKGVFSRRITIDLLYLISVAVKDYEVTRLLYERGYVKDQVSYNKYFLEPSKEEIEAWKLVNNETAKFLVLVSLLKTACCATPLLKDERYNNEVSESIVKSMSYLPSGLSTHLFKLLEAASNFGERTHENVNLFMNKIVDELVIKGGYLKKNTLINT